MKNFYTNNAEEMKELAARLVKTWKGGDVVGLVGDLGTGKTTFVQGVARALGIKRAVKSPTFLRLQVYKVSKSPVIARSRRRRGNLSIVGLLLRQLRFESSGLSSRVSGLADRNDNLRYFVHIDAYRVKNPEQLLELGLEDYLGRKDALVVVEWADRVRSILPRNTQWIRLRHGGHDGERRISYHCISYK